MVICSSCGSSRIRNDYRPAPLILRMIGIRALLCDHCNRQFRAFSLRSPHPHPHPRAARKADVFAPGAAEVDLEGLRMEAASAPAETRDPRLGIGSETVASGAGLPAGELRRRIDMMHERAGEAEFREVEVAGIGAESDPCCPDCGSPDVRKRHRTGVERAVFSLTDHKAYACVSCGAHFYAREEGLEGRGGVARTTGAA